MTCKRLTVPLRDLNLLGRIAAGGCLTAALTATAQSLHFSGYIRQGAPYRHRIGDGLTLVVSTDGIAVRPASGGADKNYAACATPPAHGPNPLDIEGWHFDPARSEGAPGARRELEFALSARSDRMECALADAYYQDDQVPGYRRQPPGRGVVILSRVRLSASKEEVASLRFRAVVTLPRPRRH